MRKNQRGIIELATMFTSTIAVIVLSTAAFISAYEGSNYGAQQTIARAGFSGFVTDLDSVRTAFLTENIPNLMGEQFAMNNFITEEQAYNYLAKGATTIHFSEEIEEDIWLPRNLARAIPCTRIESNTAKEAIGIDLPLRTVNTYGATGVEMSYFVTNKGDIFVWPPYYRAEEDSFYINDVTELKTLAGNTISLKDEYLMYEDGFEFDIKGVKIKISNKSENANNILTKDITLEELIDMPSIYYKDGIDAEAPEGIESKFIFSNYYSKVPGVDND